MESKIKTRLAPGIVVSLPVVVEGLSVFIASLNFIT